MFYQYWIWFAQAVTVLVLLRGLVRIVGLPVFESNATTLMCVDPIAQRAVAEALSTVLKNPLMRLDTRDVKRFLFRDGTSVDALSPDAPFQPPYSVNGVKQIVLPFWSIFRTPRSEAEKIRQSLAESAYESTVELFPDRDVPCGSSALVFSDAFLGAGGSGFAIILRKNALRMGGQVPRGFKGF